MTDQEPSTVREEAQRLVATGLAAVSMVADRIGAANPRERGGPAAAAYEALGDTLFGPSGHRRHHVADGSAACDKCPVCRVIAAAREPHPQTAQRLATGVGTLAEGAARLLRTVAGVTRPAGQPAGSGRQPAGGQPAEADPWAAATAGPA